MPFLDSDYAAHPQIPVLVLGVGNTLMGDDGIGVELINQLRPRISDPRVQLEDGGTLGMSLLPFIEDADTVIMLDAVKTGHLPGQIIVIEGDEIPRHFSSVISPHQIGMKEVLGAAQLCGTLPRRLILLGIEAQDVGFCAPISTVVNLAIPAALTKIEMLIHEALDNYNHHLCTK